ncbi:MAG: restriction endonuclease subunit S [Candidatus Omnitrophica bacterium]|jgi:type I restriction enzyme S subunit|nr:restriction endonuclease subunit S [Candidatus Omnitrophota bacterium]MDD4607483.1 restriction endonuclease subunit S [Patescibacteria group bacterium]
MNKQIQKNIPREWTKQRLGSIGVFTKGAGISKDQLSEVGHNVVRYGELYTKFDVKIERIYSYIPSEIIPSTREIKYGDILFAGSGETNDEIGKSAVYFLKESCYAGGDIIIFSPKSANSLFLSYFLNTGEARKRLRELGQGQSVVHIHKNDLENLEFNFPLLEEQNRIVRVLETWDSAIEKLGRKIEIKKRIKKGLMRELLAGKTRLSGFNGEWEANKLSDVCEIKKGLGLSKVKLNDKGKYECILYGELYTTYSEIINEIKSKTNEKEGNLSMAGDILIPSSTTTCALDLAIAACLNRKKVLLGGDISILRAKKIYNSIFLALYLSHIKKHNLARLAQGITIVHLYGKDFKKIEISIPKIEEQNAIADILVTADREIAELERKLGILKNQKKYLLNNLITGAIRVPEGI